jgi:hypothetical protein
VERPALLRVEQESPRQSLQHWQATLFSSWLFSMAGWSKNFK